MVDSRRHRGDGTDGRGNGDPYSEFDRLQPSVRQMRRESDVEITDATIDEPSPLEQAVDPSTDVAVNDPLDVPGIDEVSRTIRSKHRKHTVAAVVAIVVVVVVVAGVALGLSGIGSGGGSETAGSSDTESSPYDNLGIIELESFYDLTLDDAVEQLGDDFALESSETEEAVDESEETYVYNVYVNTVELADEWSSAPTRVELIVDSEQVVKGVGYTVSMDRAGFEYESFESLVGTQDALLASLEAAGISDVVTTYSTPSADTYTSYLDPTAEELEVSRYSVTFTGATGYTNLPGTWTVTFTYDYRGYDDYGNEYVKSSPTRTIEILLS